MELIRSTLFDGMDLQCDRMRVANAAVSVCVCGWNRTNLFVVIDILFIQRLSCEVVVALFATVRVLFDARQHCCCFLLRILHFGHDLWLV